jgi:hypothetical protein
MATLSHGLTIVFLGAIARDGCVGVLLFNLLSLAFSLSENTTKERRQWHGVETKQHQCAWFVLAG